MTQQAHARTRRQPLPFTLTTALYRAIVTTPAERSVIEVAVTYGEEAAPATLVAQRRFDNEAQAQAWLAAKTNRPRA